MTATILVTGGAGYIGSHAVLALQDAGLGPVVLDDLSTGRRWLVPDGVPFIEGDVGDQALVADVIDRHRIDAVMHFAGSIVVPESVADPLKYYRNNTANSRNLIEACVTAGVDKFIFSSTAAIYGTPETFPVDENTPAAPINPYGASKLMTEWMLRDVGAASGLQSIILRYFNVAGADPDGRSGLSSPNATHLLKVACEAAAGKRDFIDIFGDDYDTPDGTGVRDYIHVSDLADAHIAAYRYLANGGEGTTLNCGYGRGFSVREVLAAVQSQVDFTLDIRTVPRRPGDAATIVSDAGRIGEVLDWQPRYDDLDFIIKTALAWERALESRTR